MFWSPIGGVGSNPTSDKIFFCFYPLKERIPISRPTILRIIFEHLCAIDHLLPNSFLLEAANQRDAKKSSNEQDNGEDDDEDDDEDKIVLDPDKLRLSESLDHICCDVIDFIQRITLAGTLDKNPYLYSYSYLCYRY